jgi:hypothetical protein
MGELGALLERLHSAASSYESFRGEFRRWTHTKRSARAFEAAAEASGGTQITMGYAKDDGDASAETETNVRIYVRRPDRIREERDGPPGCERVVVRKGDAWWARDHYYGHITGEDSSTGFGIGEDLDIVLDPSPLPGLLELSVTGRGRIAGRETIRARAAPRPRPAAASFSSDLHRLGGGADEYLLEADAERGVLLRLEARLESEPFAITEATTAEFDPDLSDSTFELAPEPGEEFATLDAPHATLGLPIHEAVTRADFALFIPSEVPEDWRLQISFSERSRRPPSPPTVALYYGTADETFGLTIVQMPADEAYESGIATFADAQTIPLEHGPARVSERSDPFFSQLETTRDGTSIRLSSSNLDAEALVTFARRLVPAPEAPPSL